MSVSRFFLKFILIHTTVFLRKKAVLKHALGNSTNCSSPACLRKKPSHYLAFPFAYLGFVPKSPSQQTNRWNLPRVSGPEVIKLFHTRTPVEYKTAISLSKLWSFLKVVLKIFHLNKMYR